MYWCVRANTRSCISELLWYGGIPAPYLAAYLSCNKQVDSIWAPLLEFLFDARVSASDKESAVSGLSSRPEGIPERIRAELVERWEDMGVAWPDPMSDSSGSHFIAPRLRLGLLIGSVSEEDFIAGVTQLACGSITAQIDALRCLAYARLGEEHQSWQITTIVQLSMSSDPAVRSNAAFALGRSGQSVGPMGFLATRHIADLLNSDGVNVPLYCLRGILSRTAPRISMGSSSLLPIILRLSTSHPALCVRQVAAELALETSGAKEV